MHHRSAAGLEEASLEVIVRNPNSVGSEDETESTVWKQEEDRV